METQLLATVARRLTQARESRGVTLEQVTRETGLAGVHRYESGIRLPNLTILIRLARYYGRPVAWFLGEASDEHVRDLAGGVDPDLLALLRELPPAKQDIVREYIPHALTFADRWCQ